LLRRRHRRRSRDYTNFKCRAPLYRVQAFNANGVSGYSNQATVRVR
jgi:hypothetical protein